MDEEKNNMVFKVIPNVDSGIEFDHAFNVRNVRVLSLALIL